jgi:DNA (cytosine-5)-methyltransferase 1
MLRAISEIQPRWVVGENVRGLTNWNGGLVFDEVQADLESQGYEVLPFLLPACAVNAPHRRDRIWFVAHTEYNGGLRTAGTNEIESRSQRLQERDEVQWATERGGLRGDATHANGNERPQGRLLPTGSNPAEGHLSPRDARGHRSNWQIFPTQSPVCGGDDGLPTELDGVTFSKWRNESIKAYGNAIVPQVAFEIFKAIELYEGKK